MAFAPDGASLATGGRSPDPVVKVWDIAAGRERLALHGHSSNVWGVGYSTNSATLASIGNDMTLRFWDPRDGRQRLTATINHGSACLALAYDPDGRRVAVGASCVQVIELEGFDTRKILNGHDNNVHAWPFGPAGRSWPRPRSTTESLFGTRRRDRGGWSCRPARPSMLIRSPMHLTACGWPSDRPTPIRSCLPSLCGRSTPTRGGSDLRSRARRQPSGRGRGRFGPLACGGRRGRRGDRVEVEAPRIVRWVWLGRPVQPSRSCPASAWTQTLFAAAEGGRAALADLTGGEPRELLIPDNPTVFAVAPGGDLGGQFAGRLDSSAAAAGSDTAGDRGTGPRPEKSGWWRFTPMAGCSPRRGPTAEWSSAMPARCARFSRSPLRLPAPMHWRSRPTARRWPSLAVGGGRRLDFARIRFSTRRPRPRLGNRGGHRCHRDARCREVVASLRASAGSGPGHRVAPAPIDTTLAEPDRECFRAAWRWIEQAPEDHNAWVGAASLLAWVRDRDGYDRLRRRLLAKYGATGDPTIAERTAKACLLLPGSDAVVKEAAGLAELSIARADQVPTFKNYFLLADGLARYRLGQFDAALAQTRMAIETGEYVQGWNMSIPAYYVRAMALARLGRLADAREAFRQGYGYGGDRHAGPHRRQPVDYPRPRICEVLRREAELVVLDAGFPADAFARWAPECEPARSQGLPEHKAFALEQR